MSRTLNTEELKSLLSSNSIKLIDIRRKEDKQFSTDSIWMLPGMIQLKLIHGKIV